MKVGADGKRVAHFGEDSNLQVSGICLVNRLYPVCCKCHENYFHIDAVEYLIATLELEMWSAGAPRNAGAGG